MRTLLSVDRASTNCKQMATVNLHPLRVYDSKHNYDV